MLPLALIALGIGAVAWFMASNHEKATADANLAHQVADAHMTAAQTNQSSAAAHVEAAQTANAVAAQKTAEAAKAAKTDRERQITSLQADLTEANNDKIAALRSIQQAAALGPSGPTPSGTIDTMNYQLKLQAMNIAMAKAQAAYDAAQARINTAEDGLRQLGLNPKEIYLSKPGGSPAVRPR